jgi:hypothetical protein
MKKTFFIFTLFIILLLPVSAFTAGDQDYDKGLKYFYSGNYEEAARYLKNYVKENPKASVYYKIGYSLYELGRHDEAHTYFEQAYLIEPEFSPLPTIKKSQRAIEQWVPDMPAGIPEEPSVSEKITGPGEVAVPEGYAGEGTEMQIPAPVVAPEKPAIGEPEMAMEQEMAPEMGPEGPGETDISPGKKFEPEITFEPPKGFPKEMDMPMMPKGLMTVMAGLNILSSILSIVFWIFMSYCLFRIGKKLNVANSWLAWVPFIQGFWPMVGAGGRSVGWGLLYLVGIPIIGGIIGLFAAAISPVLAMIVLAAVGILVLWAYIHLWMNISEGLGKERLLGLLMLLPLVNIIFMGYLAFSSEG